MIGSLELGDGYVHPLLRKLIRLSGIFAGSREIFRDMNVAIAVNGIRPVVDEIYDFNNARTAYCAFGLNEHFGKIVIRHNWIRKEKISIGTAIPVPDHAHRPDRHSPCRT